jgi:hypothetical protein
MSRIKPAQPRGGVIEAPAVYHKGINTGRADEAFMSLQTHNTLSPFPFPRSVNSEVAGPSHQTSRDTHHGLAPERRQWPRKFWIYESPPSSSQDSKSNTSSGSKSTSTGSETSEERRVRTASPYGAFFVEEMEIDTPAESRPFRPGDGQEHTSGATRRVLSKWTSQVQMAGVPAPDHDATGITPSSLAENSRQSRPPLSWCQGHLDHVHNRRE